MCSFVPACFAIMLFLAVFIAFLEIHEVLCGEPDTKQSEIWDYHEILDEEKKYNLYWTVKQDIINFKVEVDTNGWVGFGLSPDGGIARSDIVIGWVDGKAQLYDYYAKNDVKLLVDEHQDWKLLSGFQNKTTTVLSFSRKLDTCDFNDRVVTNDSQHIIYAYTDEDPKSSRDVNYRQTRWNTMLVLLLLRPKVRMTPMPEDVSYFDVRADNFTPPSNRETFYHCRIVQGPRLKRKHHIVKITPVIRPQSEGLVHHYILYQCFPENRTEAEAAMAVRGAECYLPGLPSLFSKCTRPVGIWAMGGGPLLFPSQAGVRIGSSSEEYFMIEQHYNNANFRSGIIDDSGARIYYTSKLRKYDALQFGTSFSEYIHPTAGIPPGQLGFVVQSHAHPQCLSMGMTKEGINIYGVFLHAHSTVKKMRFRHFRKNKELPNIVADMSYDSHHQWFRYLPKLVKVLPGDQLTVECFHDTRARDATIFYSLGARDEMCGAISLYYPEMRSLYTEGSYALELVAGLTGMNISAGDYRSIPKSGEINPNEREYLQNYNWPDSLSQMCIIQEALRYSPLPSYCAMIESGIQNMTWISYPDKLEEYKERRKCPSQLKTWEENELESRCRQEKKKKPTRLE